MENKNNESNSDDEHWKIIKSISKLEQDKINRLGFDPKAEENYRKITQKFHLTADAENSITYKIVHFLDDQGWLKIPEFLFEKNFLIIFSIFIFSIFLYIF